MYFMRIGQFKPPENLSKPAELDLIASLFAISRLPSEADERFAVRLVSEIGRLLEEAERLQERVREIANNL